MDYEDEWMNEIGWHEAAGKCSLNSSLLFAALSGVTFQQHRLPCRKTARQKTVARLRRPQLSGRPAFPSKDMCTHTHTSVHRSIPVPPRCSVQMLNYWYRQLLQSRRRRLLSHTSAAEPWAEPSAVWDNPSFFFHTRSRDMNRQHIEMIIKALWDGWILGQVECAHSHLQNEHLLSSDRC